MNARPRGLPVIDPPEPPRQKIVAEAMQMVCAGDAGGVTIRDLARRLGFAPASIYSHFRNKEDLLRQVAAQGFEQLVEATRAATQLADVRRAITEGANRYLDFALAHPALYKLMFDEPDLSRYRDDPTVELPGRALFDLYRDLFARSAASGSLRSVDPYVQTVISWSAIHGFAMLALSGRLPPRQLRESSPDAIRQSFVAFLAAALRP